MSDTTSAAFLADGIAKIKQDVIAYRAVAQP
jgi:hypothetical protein